MTLLICPECQAHVSEQTKTCPACGCPVKGTSTPLMAFVQKEVKRKKLIGFLIIVVAMVSLFYLVTNEEYGFTPWPVIVFILGVIVFMLGRHKD
jgi:di/tricarboxylate transporter